VAFMSEARAAPTRRALRLLGEPTVIFFVIGALLFIAHRLIEGDPETIVVGQDLKADLARRFRDEQGRRPTPAELEAVLTAWKRDEALYREARRLELEQDDPAIRRFLADRMRARVAREIPRREPSDADLEHWLATHRELYEIPPRYDYEYVAFPRSAPTAERDREQFERALSSGAAPATLGRPILGGNLTAEELSERFGTAMAERIRNLPPGQWQPLENDEQLWLARLKRVTGGLPTKESLRERLVADWSFAQQQQAIERAVQAIVDRYHFEEQP